MIDEWCATDPHRYIPLSILPLWDVDACVAEIHRAADKGTRTISFPENTYPLGLPSLHDEHWDPVWRAAAERQLPLSLHFGTSGQSPRPSPDGPLAVSITLFGCNSMYAVADLLFSPVFHKHPNLKVALSEGGIGWVPYLLERADYVWDRHRHYQNVNQDIPPSELFRRNVYACFIEDKHGLAVRHSVGVGNILWECDYPHSDSNWPNSRKVAEDVFADIPNDEVGQIVETNARELFRFPRAAG
jgi:predicted TIM-barrel fold metal-dependent hydrolase